MRKRIIESNVYERYAEASDWISASIRLRRFVRRMVDRWNQFHHDSVPLETVCNHLRGREVEMNQLTKVVSRAPVVIASMVADLVLSSLALILWVVGLVRGEMSVLVAISSLVLILVFIFVAIWFLMRIAEGRAQLSEYCKMGEEAVQFVGLVKEILVKVAPVRPEDARDLEFHLNETCDLIVSKEMQGISDRAITVKSVYVGGVEGDYRLDVIKDELARLVLILKEFGITNGEIAPWYNRANAKKKAVLAAKKKGSQVET